MRMPPAIRKTILTAHVVTSVGWAGALAVFLAHSLLAWSSTDPEVVRVASLAMATSAWLVILPLALAALVTGIFQALTTQWG
jgi:Na+-driven multidrug efflux pump